MNFLPSFAHNSYCHCNESLTIILMNVILMNVSLSFAWNSYHYSYEFLMIILGNVLPSFTHTSYYHSNECLTMILMNFYHHSYKFWIINLMTFLPFFTRARASLKLLTIFLTNLLWSFSWLSYHDLYILLWVRELESSIAFRETDRGKIMSGILYCYL